MEPSHKGHKFRLYPTFKQRNFIDRTIGCGRMVYNWALGMRKEAYEKDGSTLSIQKDISPKIPELKKERPFLCEVDSKGLIGELNNLNSAYEKFFKEGGGFPKFKHKESIGSYTTQLFKKWIDVENNRVKLPKIGLVKCVFHREIAGEIKEKPYVTISRTATSEYYISILASYETPVLSNEKANEENTIGIDLGLKDFAILSDGTKFDKFESDKKKEKKKKHLQRRLSKKVGSGKGEKKSNNYIKLQKKISRLDQKIAMEREQYQYNVVSDIVKKGCRYIAVEDLNVKGMSASGKSKEKLTSEEYAKLSKSDKKKYNRKKNKGFNRSVLNQGLYSFKLKLKHKAHSEGSEVVEIGRFYPSSQTCSHCGYRNKKVKNLRIREWTCPQCGTHHDRDINAAINIKREAIRKRNEE